MKDFIIILLLLGLLWGSYKGMTYLGSFAKADTTESATEADQLADHSEKRLNQSAIKEMKKAPPEIQQKKAPVVKTPEETTPPTEKTNGQKAMEAVRDTRLDIEGKPRSKEDFYKESSQEEIPPYERKDGATSNQATQTNETDRAEQKAAMAEKGKSLASEFEEKGATATRKSTTTKKTSFNIEKGESEPVTPPARPQAYNQPSKKFIPSKYILVAGSYASSENAVKEVLRLKKQGFQNASIVLSDRKLNLISLGSFSNKAAANARAAEIKKAGINLYVKGMR